MKNNDRLANLEINEHGEKQIIILNKEFETKDLDELFDSLYIVSEYNRINNIYNMVINNGKDYHNIMKLSENISYINENKISSNELVMKANKAIFNYCSSIGMYLDVIEKSLVSIDKQKLDIFRKESSRLYDERLEYRFFCIMRNYILHYDLPYNVHQMSLESSKVICSKDHLLKFKKWKHVKKDIEEMEAVVDIAGMVNEMNLSLTILLLQYQLLISDKVIESWEIANSFMKKYEVTRPLVVRNYSVEAHKKGNLSLTPIDLSGLISLMKQLMNHPNINIIAK